MTRLFLRVLNMSISAGWLVLAVLILRLVLKKAPKWVNVLLWGIVAVRLVCPFSIESALSLIPSAETIPEKVMSGPSFDVRTGIAPVDNRINEYLGDHYFEGVSVPANNGIHAMTVLSAIWGIGILLLIAYAAISYWHLRHMVDTAVFYKDGIFQSENISFSFVLGMIKPRIYLPFKIDGQNLQYIVAHEQAHIRRKDQWWKFFGFLLLTVYWFHPLMWLAYVLLCRDIELACDERVIKELDNERRADYTQALVDCSVNQRRIAACPLAFGEVGVKERVKSVMNYRKPAFWMIVLAVVACAAVAVCFLTNPPRLRYDEANAAPGLSATKWFDYLETPDEMPWDGCLEIRIPEIPDTTFRWYPERMEAVSGKEIFSLYSGMPIWNTYFCDLTGDGAPELCSTLSFGSGMIDSRIMIYDYANGASYELEDRGTYDYTLRQGSGDGLLYVDKRDYNSEAFIATGPLLFADGYLQIGFAENKPAYPDNTSADDSFAYDAFLSGDRTLLAGGQDETWWIPDFGDGGMEYEYTYVDVSGDGSAELVIQMSDAPYGYNGVFHLEDGEIFCWNSDAAEMSCWDFPLNDGAMVRQYDMGGASSYTVFRYTDNGEQEELHQLFARKELIPEDSKEPCPYYEIDGAEVEEPEFNKRLNELVTSKMLKSSDWTGLQSK